MRYLLWLVLSASLLTSCAAVRRINLISTPEELKLGAQFSREIEQQITLYNDPVVLAYIDSLGQVIARHSRRANIPYHIAVVDTDEVNAFAIPGGYLYVNRALIETADTESELAGVMGHEIGHVVARHGARQLTKRLGLSIIVALAAGEEPDLTRKIVADIVVAGGTFSLLHYSREAEQEADRLAVRELYDSGIDPEGIVIFFEKLLSLQKRQLSSLEKLFSTHPPTEERIADVRAEIVRLPEKTGLSSNSQRFHAIKERIARRRSQKNRR
ncbi:MAG: M48 family metalloprotease [Candidatus Latescibacteria bacterium]|nr:M48 family metalloprotease [Candidatus Latescibacterota bacterium]